MAYVYEIDASEWFRYAWKLEWREEKKGLVCLHVGFHNKNTGFLVLFNIARSDYKRSVTNRLSLLDSSSQLLFIICFFRYFTKFTGKFRRFFTFWLCWVIVLKSITLTKEYVFVCVLCLHERIPNWPKLIIIDDVMKWAMCLRLWFILNI